MVANPICVFVGSAVLLVGISPECAVRVLSRPFEFTKSDHYSLKRNVSRATGDFCWSSFPT
jgi:hypothetical protein